MKKTLFVSMCVFAVIIMASCATTGGSSSKREVKGAVPQFVKDAVAKDTEGTLVGVGTANMPTLNASRTAAAQRARAEISRQMVTMVRDMQRDFTAANEMDHAAATAYFDTVTVNLSRSQFSGASIVAEDIDDKGNYWVVVKLTKTAAMAEINQAQAQARLAAPANAANLAVARMNEQFDIMAKQDVEFSNR